jgi:hypothetical protein
MALDVDAVQKWLKIAAGELPPEQTEDDQAKTGFGSQRPARGGNNIH